jgi:hypothetical protein
LIEDLGVKGSRNPNSKAIIEEIGLTERISKSGMDNTQASDFFGWGKRGSNKNGE